MKQVLKIWGLAAALLSLAASCSKGQDNITSEPSTPTETSGEAAPVSARLTMETTLPEHDLRMAEYVVLKKTTSGGYTVDLDAIAASHGGKIPISCIIRSDDPSQPVTYTEVLFTREDGNTLRIGGQPVTLEAGTDFTNAGGRKWYIMGWLGTGNLGGTNGLTTDKKLKNGVDGHLYGHGHDPHPYDRLGITPLMFPWKEIKLDNEGGVTLGNARKVDMKLRGAFIKVTVTNKTGSWFPLSGSSVYSNAFTSFGSYNMDVAPVEGVFPQWTPDGTPDSEGLYRVYDTFTNMQRLTIGGAYQNLIWVMPMPSPPANPQTKIRITGGYNSLTFVTNKPVRTTTLKEGKVYTLNIDVYRPMMGLDYMAEYDLLNGTTTTPGTFATTHYNRQPGSLYQWNSSTVRNILCPSGWHIPESWEWEEATVSKSIHSGGPTFSETKRLWSDQTLSSQMKQEAHATYYLRYAGDPMNYGAISTNNFREAQRTRMIDNPDGGTLGTGEKMLEITSRYLGSSFTGTVDDLVTQSEDWWSDPNYTVRRVLSAGHFPMAASSSPSSGHYYGPSRNGSMWYLWNSHLGGGTNMYYVQSVYIRPFKDR